MVSREDYNDPASKSFTCSCSTTIDKDKPHTCDGSAELTRLMDEGCNHMTCTTPACNTHFCYVCGGKVIQSVIRNEINEAIMQHFSNCKLFDVPDEE
ncbi:hypothetical protein AG1IA_09053 [Rhizoctonia solani AG-1 IA]|uniref:IBR domain-containing protein n=1 Tax=Thanatephorus cucumeris (strain AG1-IA) TaxID=983506 RepID=L8WFG2_THACA|nr:hypothetical protein AG1IA_09053 [Rhizoctonia solani AG-1 IA]